MTPTVAAEISTQAITHNLNRVRDFAGESRVMAVIKANAYGHGVQRALAALGSADAIGVGTLEEAIEVRRFGYAGRICVMSRMSRFDELKAMLDARLWPVLHDLEHIGWFEHELGNTRLPPVWLKVDSGMHRLGLDEVTAAEVAERLTRAGATVSIMTHFACADDPEHPATARQTALFDSVAVHGDVARSAANSAAVVAHPATHYDWVRPGIMLYGISPIKDTTAAQLDLRPAMTLKARITSVRAHRAGEPSGYGETWRSTRNTCLAAVGCGYADGYPRDIPSGTPIVVNGVRYPVAGRVSMDTTMIDIGPEPSVKVGDVATLWGDALPAEEIAEAAGTIAYELLCRVSTRVERVSV